jgi:hypothetical protein
MISGTFKRSQINKDMYRPYCQACNENLSAINYVRKGVVYFRKLCTHCIRKKSKIKPVPPAWVKSGYKKKTRCDKCNFVAKNTKTQLRVYYVDGNLKNNDWNNLKTICLNCQAALADFQLGWKPADLIADY